MGVSVPIHLTSNIVLEAVGKTVVIHKSSPPNDLLRDHVAYIQWGPLYLLKEVII